jgi:hypothetical protein
MDFGCHYFDLSNFSDDNRSFVELANWKKRHGSLRNDWSYFSDNAKNLRVRMAKGYDGFEEKKFELDARQKPFDDPFSVLKAVVWGGK